MAVHNDVPDGCKQVSKIHDFIFSRNLIKSRIELENIAVSI